MFLFADCLLRIKTKTTSTFSRLEFFRGGNLPAQSRERHRKDRLGIRIWPRAEAKRHLDASFAGALGPLREGAAIHVAPRGRATLRLASTPPNHHSVQKHHSSHRVKFLDNVIPLTQCFLTVLKESPPLQQ